MTQKGVFLSIIQIFFLNQLELLHVEKSLNGISKNRANQKEKNL